MRISRYKRVIDPILRILASYAPRLKEGMSVFERLANATVKVECGKGPGSGFHFLREDIIVTNHHVVEAHVEKGVAAFAVTEAGHRFRLQLLAYSHKDQYDYAIFQATEALPDGRIALTPKVQDYVPRGTEICFAGFPHGIDDLLVQEAYVSGPVGNIGFHIDGSVNGGNSGGPVIDVSDQTVVGIVTQRRFLGGQDLEEIGETANELYRYCNQIADRGSAVIMGIDFGRFAGLMSQSFVLISKIIEANANTGIGIGFHIKFVVERCKQLTLN